MIDIDEITKAKIDEIRKSIQPGEEQTIIADRGKVVIVRAMLVNGTRRVVIELKMPRPMLPRAVQRSL
jgi:hypothetical protein